MAWSWGHPSLVMLRTFADEHYTYDRRSGCLTADEGHNTSCPPGSGCGGSTYDPAEWERGGSYRAFGHEQRR